MTHEKSMTLEPLYTKSCINFDEKKWHHLLFFIKLLRWKIEKRQIHQNKDLDVFFSYNLLKEVVN